jgi:vitamin B12 transporter
MLAAMAQALLAASAPVEPTPAIIVTASRLDSAPVAATTEIDRNEIEALQPVSLLDILDGSPGLRAVSVGGIGGGSFLSLRGGEPNFTLVTIEGLKLNNPTNSRGGAFDLSLIDPDLVESLTIVRGSGSAIHGSDALSGLVAIRLRAPRAEGANIGGRLIASSEGEAGATISGRAGWVNGGILAAGAHYDSGSLDLGSTLERRQALVQLQQQVGGFRLAALAVHARTRRETFPEDSGGPLLAINRELERGRLSLAAGALGLRRDPAAPVRPNLLLSWSRQVDDTEIPAIAPGVFGAVPASESRSLFERLEAVADLALDAGPVSATAGAALLREEGRSEGSLDLGFPLPTGFDVVRTTYSGFVEASWGAGGAVVLNLAGRVDSVAGASAQWTWRGSGRWRLSPAGATLFATIGTGYKLPSFFALANAVVGNPDLEPERSLNADLGLIVPAGRGAELKLTLFRNHFRDLVDFDAASFRFVNRDEVTIAGAEVEMRWRPSAAFELAGALTMLDIESPTPLRNRPRWQGTLRLTWRPNEDVDVTAQLRGNSDFFDASIPTGLIVAGGHIGVDLGLSHRFARRLRLDVAARNLTNVRDQTAVGFPASPRLLRVSLAVQY